MLIVVAALPDAPIAPVVVGSPTSYTITVSWPVTAGNAYAVDYYQLQYVDLYAPVPAWKTVQCDNLGDGIVSDWYGHAHKSCLVNPMMSTAAYPLPRCSASQ